MMSSGDAARLVNAALAAHDVRDKKDASKVRVLPPQMFYNYTIGKVRAGERPLIKCEIVDGKVDIDREDLTRWARQYIAKAKAAVVVHEPLEIDLDA